MSITKKLANIITCLVMLLIIALFVLIVYHLIDFLHLLLDAPL